MNLQELRDGLAFVAAVLADIHERAGIDPLDTETQTRWDEGQAYVIETRATIERLEARDAQIAELRSFAAAHPQNIIPGAPTADERHVPNVNLNRDPFDMSTAPHVRDHGYSPDLVGRARTIAEKHAPSWTTDDQVEAMLRTAEKESSRYYDADLVNEHIVRTSDPAYLRDFRQMLRSPNGGMPGAVGAYYETRTAMSLTAANGGVLVPQWLDPTIILTNAGTENEIRKVSRIEQVTVDQADFVTSAGVTAEWLAENTESADATPTFVGPTITNYKAAATLLASYEVLADSGFDQQAYLVADAFDRLEETAFTTGSGSGQPFGLITRLSGTGPKVTGTSTVSGITSTGDFVVGDVYKLENNLDPRWLNNARWMANKAIYNLARQFSTSTQYQNYWTDLGGGQPPMLIGYPAHRNNAMDSTVVSGSDDPVLLLGDFKQYIITDRVGTTIMFEPIMKGTSGGRPNGQAAWFAFKRVGADVATSNAFKLLVL